MGEICGRFFNAEGQECDTPWRDRVVGIELEQLRTIPQVIGIVAGSNRSRAIAAAISGGLLKSLIIDEGGANALPFPSFAAGHSTAPASTNPKSRSGSVTAAAAALS
ncbi:MAG: transcriptional regulator with sigma factor-related N-terminal domain [Verrucomicrobiales bacterium]|nr:transcriptional regulator with sigma factor-related N-terminal domain [Verrucomicrobiales bacterium]